MRVNMEELVELEPMKKIDEIRRFSNKELRLTKELMRVLPKSSEYCEPITKKAYSYVVRDCFSTTNRRCCLDSGRQEMRRLGTLLISRLSWVLCWEKK